MLNDLRTYFSGTADDRITGQQAKRAKPANRKIMDRKIKKKQITLKRVGGILIAGGFLAFGFYQFVSGDYITKLDVKKELKN